MEYRVMKWKASSGFNQQDQVAEIVILEKEEGNTRLCCHSALGFAYRKRSQFSVTLTWHSKRKHKGFFYEEGCGEHDIQRSYLIYIRG